MNVAESSLFSLITVKQATRRGIPFYRIRLLAREAAYNTLNGNEFSLLNPRALSRRAECLKAARITPRWLENFYIAITSNRRLRDEV